MEDVDLWCRFLAYGFKGHDMLEQLYVFLEDQNAVFRRTLRARINSAVTRYHGYKLMGFRGLCLYKPFLNIMKAFVPAGFYKIIHKRRLQRHIGN